MRPKLCAVVAACVTATTAASALGPPTVVHTKDGSVYYGTLVERVADDHVSILTATGDVKRFAMKDVDPSPPPTSPLYQPPAPGPPIYDAVRMKDGSLYYGQLIERVVNDHVTVKLETGETKVLAWDNVDPTPAPPPPAERRTAAPIENVRTVDGSFYHGEIVELVAHDHVTIRTVGGLRTIDWKDIDPRPLRSALTRRDTRVGVSFVASDMRASLQQAKGVGWADVCLSPCDELVSSQALFRVGGDGVVPSRPFRLGEKRMNAVHAQVGSSVTRTLGFVLIGVAIPVMIAGTGMALTALGAPDYSDHTPFDVATLFVNVGGLAMVIAGATLASRSSDAVTINGSLLGRIAAGGIRF